MPESGDLPETESATLSSDELHPVAVGAIRDGECPITRVNDAFEEAFRSGDSVIGSDITELLAPSGGEQTAEELREQVASGEFVETNVECPTREGRRRFRVSVAPHGTAGDRPDGWSAWYRGITEREVRERRLRQYRQVAENQHDVSFILSEDGTVEFIVDQVSDMLGWDKEDLIGKQATEAIGTLATDPEIEARAADAIDAVLEGESQTNLRATIATEKLDERVISIRLTPYRPNGTTEGVVGISHDITELEERTRQLHRQKAKIEALHDVAAKIEACENTDDVYEEVVSAAESILEFDIAIADAEDDGLLIPQAVSSTLSDDDYYDETPVDEEDSAAATAYRTGESSVVDDVSHHAADPASVEFRSGLTVPIGEHGMFQAVSRSTGAFDETDRELAELLAAHGDARLTQLERERELREQTEQLKRQNERLDQFANVVSHDLRNPLNVAESYVELARQDQDCDRLDDATAALDRMGQLIDDLLTLARKGQQARDVESLALEDLVEASWRTVETGEATLVCETTRTLQADRRQLTQLLENLFRNSIEHGADGGEVTITVGELPDGFFVEDEGSGLPEADRDQLFEVGYSNTKTGTGFGLGIVEEIANTHGWDIAATDSESGGARFEVTGIELE